jgi:putative membrane protein
MRLFSRLIFSFFTNLIALIIASNFIPGFEISGNFTNILIAAAIFVLINIYVRPLVKFILSPVIILTLGLFILVINAGMLYLLDILSVNVTITGIESLAYATLLITAVNFLLGVSAKQIFKRQ